MAYGRDPKDTWVRSFKPTFEEYLIDRFGSKKYNDNLYVMSVLDISLEKWYSDEFEDYNRMIKQNEELKLYD